MGTVFNHDRPWAVGAFLVVMAAAQLVRMPPAVAGDEDAAVQRERRRIEQLVAVLRPHAPWTQVELGGSFYDTRREVISPRLNLGLSGGYRAENFGLLASIEVDQNWDFTRETDTLTLLNTGVGAELLYVVGHARTTAIVGISTLLEQTDLDAAGTMGWFVDLRPVSIRWAVGQKAAVELTPVGLDVSVPVTDGIPLVLVSFMARLGVEWSFQ